MKKTSSKSTLFLIELVIAILFFAITSAICVQIFAKAHMYSRDTKQINYALNQINSIAAYIRAYDGDIEKVSEAVSYENQNLQIELYYDDNWVACDNQKAVFSMTVKWLEEEQVLVNVQSLAQQKEILSQLLAYHTPKTLAEVS